MGNIAANKKESLEKQNKKKSAKLKVGIIGYGYWGPNVARNFYLSDHCKLAAIADQSKTAQDAVYKFYKDVEVYSSDEEILTSKDIDVVAIVTPVSTHYELAKKALLNGKHVFIEKPMTQTSAQAEELIAIAKKRNLKIMVDYTFLFTGAVKKIKESIDSGKLGKLYYYDSTRVNLGIFQHDTNVIWDLAPHDLSILDYVCKEKPVAISATGIDHFNGFCDVAYITLYFKSDFIAHFTVNWLAPVKVRTTLIGGEKKMIVWNDVVPDEKIKIYDRGVDVRNRKGLYKMLQSYRWGDMVAPNIENNEALRSEVKYFVDCILNNQKPFNDGESGLRIVKMLEASNESIKNDGKKIKL